MLIKQALLALVGLCSGFAVAAGVFAVITAIGIVPRLAERTHTRKHIYGYESMIIWGGCFGNILSVYWPSSALDMGMDRVVWHPLFIHGGFAGNVLLLLFGIFSGVFVGCLAMALAEALKVFPILTSRLQIKEGFPVIVLALAFGKAAGALFQFYI